MIAEKKNKLTKKAQTVLLVISCIVFIYGAVTSYQAEVIRSLEKAAEKFEFAITEKTNDRITSSSFYYNFGFIIKNNSDKNASRIEGTLKIMDKDEKLLSSGTAYFSSDFKPGAEKMFNLNWEMDMTSSGEQIWESDLDDLIISYDIETMYFEDGQMVEVDLDAFIINGD